MSSKPQTNSDEQEIDLSLISKKIGSFFDGISAKIFKGILFIQRNSIILLVLCILGALAGYFLDKASNSYEHEIIVSPNLGSTDYLYDKVDLLNSKIAEGDTLFLKSIGINKPTNIGEIKVEPIIDIYSFVNSNTGLANNAQNTQNFELVKLLSEDGDIEKVIKDPTTSRNYGRHVIHITTKGSITNKNVIVPIMKYLNQNSFYESLRKVLVSNIKAKMKQNQIVITQIDALLNEFSAVTAGNQKSEKLVYYNENTQLNEIIKTKNYLVGELGGQKIDLVNNSQVIMNNSTVLNVKSTKGLHGKMKILVPLFFLFGFISFRYFRKFYKKHSARLETI